MPTVNDVLEVAAMGTDIVQVLEGYYVQFRSKTGGSIYTSANPTTGNGFFKLTGVAADTYEVFYSLASSGPWIDTGWEYIVLANLGIAGVDLTTNQTIAGIKTFTARPVLPDDYVDRANTQSIGGQKTFNLRPILPGDYVDLVNTQTIGGNKTFSGNTVFSSTPTFSSMRFSGITGALNQAGIVGATTGGPPLTGTFQTGDMVVDRGFGGMWTCTAGGSPGNWRSCGELLYNRQTPSSGTSIVIPAAGTIPSWVDQIRVAVKVHGNSTTDQLRMRFNNDSGINYDFVRSVLGGTYASTGTVNGSTYGELISEGSTSTAQCAEGDVKIYNPQDTAQRKGWTSFFMSYVSANTPPEIASGDWVNTSNAITSITFFLTTGPFTAGTVFETYVMGRT